MSQTANTAALPAIQFHGHPIIAHLSYRLFFLGSIWSTPFLAEQAGRVDTALKAALQDPALNQVFAQYLSDGQAGPVTAAPAGDRVVVDMAWPARLTRDDLAAIAQGLLDKGMISANDTGDFGLTLILPPGTVMIDPRDAVQSSSKGLASIHGTFHLTSAGGPVPVHFCAAVWSDGTNGVAVPAFQDKPAWLPWENTCAALYHELAELRTNPNVDEAPEPGMAPPPDRLGWAVCSGGLWLELPDLPVLWAGDLPQKVFLKGTVGGVGGVPIQALWSKHDESPHMPEGFVPQMHLGFR